MLNCGIKNPNEAQAEDNTPIHFRYTVHIHAIYELANKQGLFSSDFEHLAYIHKGDCTKVQLGKLQTWSFFPLVSYNSALRFSFGGWKCIHRFESDTITE